MAIPVQLSRRIVDQKLECVGYCAAFGWPCHDGFWQLYLDDSWFVLCVSKESLVSVQELDLLCILTGCSFGEID